MDKKIKVCYITHQPNLTGANQSMLDALINSDDDTEKLVIVRKYGALVDKLKENNIDYRIVKYTTASASKVKKYRDLFRRIRNRIAVERIKDILEDEKVDIVENNTMYSGVGMEAAYSMGVPYIAFIRELGYEDQETKWMNPKRQYFLLNHADRVIAISEFVKERYTDILKNNKNVIVRHNGIDDKKYFRPHNPLFENGEINMLLAGRAIRGKGHLEAIKACAILVNTYKMNVKLHITGTNLGSDEYIAEMKALVKTNNIDNNVVFHDFIDLSELRKICDINLMCSKAESLGRVTIEGMMAGCLCLGSDTGATPEIISDGYNGFLYKNGDSYDLAKKIVYASENRELCTGIAENGKKEAIKKYGIDEYCRFKRELYEAVIEERNK